MSDSELENFDSDDSSSASSIDSSEEITLDDSSVDIIEINEKQVKRRQQM